MPARKQRRAKPGPQAAEDGIELPEWPGWEGLPARFRDVPLFFRRSAYMLDGAHKRCPRRDCRARDLCLVGHDDADGCRGNPSERAEHRVEGMWMARTFDLFFEIAAAAEEEADA